MVGDFPSVSSEGEIMVAPEWSGSPSIFFQSHLLSQSFSFSQSYLPAGMESVSNPSFWGLVSIPNPNTCKI